MTSDWRPLEDHEIAVWSKARMGGALLVVAIATGLLSLALFVIMLMLGSTLMMHGAEGLGRMLNAGNGRYAMIGLVSGVSMLLLLFGSLIVFVMTLARAPATPVVASIGAFMQFAAGIATNVAIQWIALEGKADLISTALLPVVPHWIGGLAGTAGFAGYMLGGVRPNAYFRRRVAVLPA